MSDRPGTVYLIGAGPGDPGLLTLRGRDCLARADVVLYDYLAGPRLLQMARSGAELYCLGKHGAGKLWKQADICQRIVAEAKAGKTVARLKGGDPSVFGRLAEEVDALQSAGVPFEIVPGVTTATAAGAYAGVTITDRDRASSVALVAGHLQADKVDGDDAPPDFAALASFPGTIVIYMGVTTAASWSGELIANGKPAETPVVLVRR
ncbi:MAG: uroporphyrinogen-III C-methyltransferase, partial [Planctomycetota bacterium]